MSRKPQGRAASITAGALLALLAGCGAGAGDTEFADGRTHQSDAADGGGAADTSADANPQADGDGGAGDAGSVGADADGGDGGLAGGTDGAPPTDVPKASALRWAFPCASDPVLKTADGAADATPVLSGGGDFAVEAGAAGLTLDVSGAACAPARKARDVIFVIDVSNSMRDFFNLGNDPLKDGTCGRNEAVGKVLAGLGPDARAALVTFDGGLKRDSGDFFAPADFDKDWHKADYLCERGRNTSFKAGLARAEELLNGMARKDAQKELYFVSDGEPDSVATGGVEEAARIREGATIATLMLKGDETLMKEQLASKDAAGVPVHAKVEQAADLATSMAKLADVTLISVTLRYGPLGQESAWTVTALDLQNGLAFTVPTVALDRAAFPEGFGFEVETVDSHGVKTTQRGRLLWK